MKLKLTMASVLLAATALSGCGKTSGSASLLAPYANAYTATYAATGMDVISQLLSQPGDKVQGAAAPVFEAFVSPNTREMDEPQALEIEKTADGYILRYGGEEVDFTSAHLVSNPGVPANYELTAVNNNGETRTLGYLFGFTMADTDDALAANDSSVVPLGFGIRVKTGDDPATADDSDAFVNGYTAVGLETNPSDMPTTGTATYSGFGRVEAYTRTADYNTDQIDRVGYQGSAEYAADFGAGTISGTMDLEERRQRSTQGGLNTNWMPVAPGAQLTLAETEIIENGFSSDITANAAAETLFTTDGLSNDAEAKAVGRFYGTDAGQVVSIIAGESSSHILTGIIATDRVP